MRDGQQGTLIHCSRQLYVVLGMHWTCMLQGSLQLVSKVATAARVTSKNSLLCKLLLQAL